MSGNDLASRLRETVTRVEQLLASTGIVYHYTGGFVSQFHGEPRMTQDIDIVVAVAEGVQISSLLAVLTDRYIYEPAQIRNVLSRGGMFQLLDATTYIKIDFHVGANVPGELGRSITVPFLPGLDIRILAKEDAILSKLLWIKKGSHKSRQDVVGMLLRNGNVDYELLNRLAVQMHVMDLLDELRAEAQRFRP